MKIPILSGFITNQKKRLIKGALTLFFSGSPVYLFAQPATNSNSSIFTQPGVIITIALLLIPLLAAVVLVVIKAERVVRNLRDKRDHDEAGRFSRYLNSLNSKQIEELLKRKETINYQLTHTELSGSLPANDDKGLLSNVNEEANIRFIAEKKRGLNRPGIDPDHSKLILWFLISATFWLVFGTSVGEYLGIKFVAPDADHFSWLSFGRLRPVHTNAVFWGWSSLAMLGLGYYVVPRVSNTPIVSLKSGWWTLYLINASVLLGSLALMAGINNGGGEYREYIWPIQLLFGIGLAITLVNFLKTVARRTTKEIYVSNWYIVASVIFAITISVVAYLPLWQNGLGETIIQGYYMHQGVGMWFMLFTLGLVYYFLPQQLNKPIYSYSLGILAFWSQIFFYTLIGTHHFVFSAIPWSLQTVAIVGSVGMVIPVVIAGNSRSISLYQPFMAFYRFYCSTLPYYHVWHYCFFSLGRYLCYSTQAYSSGAATNNGRHSFLDVIYRPYVLFYSFNDRRDYEGIDVDGWKTFYRQRGVNGSILVMAGNRRYINVGIAPDICL